MGRRLPYIVETHNVRMIDEFHDDDFAFDSKPFSLNFLCQTVKGDMGCGQGGLGDNFDGSELARFGVPSNSNAA